MSLESLQTIGSTAMTLADILPCPSSGFYDPSRQPGIFAKCDAKWRDEGDHHLAQLHKAVPSATRGVVPLVLSSKTADGDQPADSKHKETQTS